MAGMGSQRHGLHGLCRGNRHNSRISSRLAGSTGSQRLRCWPSGSLPVSWADPSEGLAEIARNGGLSQPTRYNQKEYWFELDIKKYHITTGTLHIGVSGKPGHKRVCHCVSQGDQNWQNVTIYVTSGYFLIKCDNLRQLRPLLRLVYCPFPAPEKVIRTPSAWLVQNLPVGQLATQFCLIRERRSNLHSAPELNDRTGQEDSFGRKAIAPTKAHLASIRRLHMQSDRDQTQLMLGRGFYTMRTTNSPTATVIK